MSARHLRARRLLSASLGTIALAGCAGAPLTTEGAPHHALAREPRWIATWAASPQPADPPLHLDGVTVREVVHVSLGGPRVRVRLSNAYGTAPLHIGAAHLATHAAGAAIAPGSDRALTFGGAADALIPEGALVLSDPVTLPVAAASELAVSLYLPDATSATTEHSIAVQTTYVSAAGDFSAAATFPAASTTGSWYFLADVEVEGPAGARAIVAVGDSITDGMKSTKDANHRWPDFLAARLNARVGGAPRAVINEGVGGNGLLREVVGANLLARIDRDAFAQPGARYLVLLAGGNDIGVPVEPPPDVEATLERLIAGQRQIVERAHTLGLLVFGATLTPFEGARFYTAAGAVKHHALNQWIRTGGAFDAVIDFDRALRDPAQPERLLPAYDSGDHLHPNDAGYEAMAGAVDLALFDDARR